MIGYTRKVGLRKSPLHFDAIRMRKVVRQYDNGGQVWWTWDEHEGNWNLDWTSDAVAMLGFPIRAQLNPCPHCCCTYTTECCYCDGSRTPLEDS